MYISDPKSYVLKKSKVIREMYQKADIPATMQPKIVGVAKSEEDAKMIQSDAQNGMDQVYPKVLPINEFGQLLVSVKSIDGVPEHLTEDEAELY